ncbi:hypothetical protein J2T61_000490 [Methanocalculus sp. AMF5]|nr:hypothetical protein [Methanocalculus sp. AMF5]
MFEYGINRHPVDARCLEERAHVPERDEQQVTGAHRVEVISEERCGKFARTIPEEAGAQKGQVGALRAIFMTLLSED